MQPHVIELTINNNLHRYTGPRCWNDLSRKQYEQLFKVGNILDKQPHALFALPEILFKIPPRMLNYLFDKAAMRSIGIEDEDYQDATIQQGNALLELCQGVARSQAPDKWFLAELKHRFTRFYGPADGLGNLTFEEFWFTEAAYSDQDYDTLISILYCANARHTRPAYTDRRTEQTRKALRGLSALEKQMIAFNYEGCRLAFAKIFPHVFKVAKDTTKKQQSSASWLPVAVSMAEEKSVEFESLKAQNLLIALQMLEAKIIKAEAAKAQIEKMKSKKR